MTDSTDTSHAPRPHVNPYWAGFALGLVLLTSFVVMGRGLGASGAFSTAVATTVHAVAPAHAESNAFYAGYLGDGTTHPMKDWLVFEVLGVFVGGFLSGALANRLKFVVEKGPRIANGPRLAFAFVGGALMAIGAKFALGCTSGQALTGGALLNVGSWAFMMCVFGGAYALAWFLRRQWL
ncbi:MAG: YeeE/YedE family protein [Opitutaceae bacterium]|nr:YeeE/YedE family protein [Opitutaceae bacterium]